MQPLKTGYEFSQNPMRENLRFTHDVLQFRFVCQRMSKNTFSYASWRSVKLEVEERWITANMN
jgi:hypothetical protein